MQSFFVSPPTSRPWPNGVDSSRYASSMGNTGRTSRPRSGIPSPGRHPCAPPLPQGRGRMGWLPCDTPFQWATRGGRAVRAPASPLPAGIHAHLPYLKAVAEWGRTSRPRSGIHAHLPSHFGRLKKDCTLSTIFFLARGKHHIVQYIRQFELRLRKTVHVKSPGEK